MFRAYYPIAALGLSLVCAGCDDDNTPPSGPRTEPPPRPSARTSAFAVARLGFQLREAGANAFFFQIDPCVETDVQVFGAERVIKEGAGKPTSGPVAVISAFQFDFCTGQALLDIFGFSGDAVFQVDRNKLTEARLQATITAFDLISDGDVQVELDVAWTGTGSDLVSASSRSRTRMPSLMVSEWIKGTFREATASGAVVVGGANLTTGASAFAEIRRVRTGRFEIVRATPEPPDTLS